MALTKSMYRALEDIVGQENISEEPAILDTYAFQWATEITRGERFGIRPEAVVLPESTEQVQAIVKACNKYKIKFKAFSTGFGSWAAPGTEGVIQLDLRRMNKILEINEKNMYAVVQPYVTSGQLQAELMKRGLTCNVINAGPQTSALPVAAMTGMGNNSAYCSVNGRNTLAVEWVLPTGDVLRLGSLGSGTGWFCGDGPGPSLRGILRGKVVPAGGFGVYTAAATKVYHWPGPPVVSIEGVSPSYVPESIPEMKAYYLYFPSWAKWADAALKISESELPYAVARFSIWKLAWSMTTSSQEALELFSKFEKKVDGPGFLLVMVANSPREFEYREKVLRQILTETGGKCLVPVGEPGVQEGLVWRTVRACASLREAMRATGAIGQGLGVKDTWDWAANLAMTGTGLERRYIEEGRIVDYGLEDWLGTLCEYGHFGHLGQNFQYDPIEPTSTNAVAEYRAQALTFALQDRHYGQVSPDNVALSLDDVGPLMYNYPEWLRKVQRAFDPNRVADVAAYIELE